MDKSEQEETRFFMELNKQFHDICKNKDVLKRTTEKFFNNLLDTITLGIIFDVHRSCKNGTIDWECDKNDTDVNNAQDAKDNFISQTSNKNLECLCPICDREVEAKGFAPHLELCMGMGRSRSRKATLRTKNDNKERESAPYGNSIGSDDDDTDTDWSSRDKRRKKKERNNKFKRNNKGTPKKSNDVDAGDSLNVDVEGDEEGTLSNFQILLQDHSNGSSPVDSNSSSSSKKRDKSSKSKKSSKKDRGSPNINLHTE